MAEVYTLWMPSTKINENNNSSNNNYINNLAGKPRNHLSETSEFI